MQKVTGIGGVFFKAQNPEKLMEWYDKNLGIKFNDDHVEFRWSDEPASKAPGSTTFSIFKDNTKYFDPGTKAYMINFRVADLNGLLMELSKNGVAVSPENEIEELDYGKFGWCVDPEGNKIELWEPASEAHS